MHALYWHVVTYCFMKHDSSVPRYLRFLDEGRE